MAWIEHLVRVENGRELPGSGVNHARRRDPAAAVRVGTGGIAMILWIVIFAVAALMALVAVSGAVLAGGMRIAGYIRVVAEDTIELPETWVDAARHSTVQVIDVSRRT